MSDFTFDEKTHTYRLRGQRLPSVTDVLTDNGFIEPQLYTEEGRIRGTRVHMLCQFFDEGDYDQREAERFGVSGYVESWRKLKKHLGILCVDIERRLHHSLFGFAGTPDRLVRINARTWILDLKTGDHEDWHGEQTGGYELLYRTLIPSEQIMRAGVHLKEDGSMAAFVPHLDQNDSNYFLAYLTTTKRRIHHGRSTVFTSR